MDDRRRWTRGDVLLLVAVASYPLFVYHRVWIGPGAEIAHFWGDTTGSYWPDLAFFARSLGQGELPLWNPNDRGGYPFAFDPQPGVLYPLNWLLAAGAAIGGGAPFWLLQLKVLLHPMLAAAAWFAWLRARHASSAGSAVGALAGSLGVFSLQQVHFSLAWPLPYVPLALWAIDRLIERADRASALALGAAVGALFSAGSPPGAFYGALVIASYGAVRLGQALGRSRGRWRDLLSRVVLAVGVAAVLALPVVWGASLLTGQSVLHERTYEYVASGSLRTDALPHFVLRQHWSGLPLYAGVSVLSLALAALVARAPSALSLWALGVSVLGLLLALGDTTPVLRWANAFFPPVRLFRGAARYVYLVQAGLAVLAALGADALFARTRVARWARRALLVGAALLVVSTVAHAALRKVFWRTGGDQVVLWIALLAVCAALARTRRGARAALAGALLVVAVDLGAAAPGAGALRKGRFDVASRVSRQTLERLLAESPDKRVWDEFAVGFRSGSRLRLRDLRGYMDPLRLRRYGDMVDALKKNPNLLARYNVHWVLHAPHPYHGSGHNHVAPGRLTGARPLERHVLELPAAEPVAVWANRVRWVDGEKQAWAALVQGPREPAAVVVRSDVPEAARTALDDLARSAAPPERRAARVVRFGNNRLTLQVDAPSAGLVVIHEAWFPFWKVEVDGADTAVFPVDGWVRGVPVEPGQHEVELVFRPAAWLASAVVAIAAWFWLGAAAIAMLVRRRRR